MLADLHTALLPILRLALDQAPLPRAGFALDLGCGAGEKLPLLRLALGPRLRIVGLDRDRAALGAHPPADGPPGSQANSVDAWAPVCADAHALPLRTGCLDGAVCIAALGLFEQPEFALGELLRALRPAAPALFVTATRRWARVTRWPEELGRLLADAAQLDGAAWPSLQASPDVGGDLAALLRSAGLVEVQVRGFLLEGSAAPALLELPLLEWDALRISAAPYLAADELARCDALVADAEIELVDVALVALGLGR
jgi:SAM-dependent methyltransferase